ncbi:MAG: T9SS type A sorting domain-containing protein [Bernardetiaceae bacterium]|nr:T9SS type A sorting domain-containing protein [Bernardetiaceae bacterium]
MLPEGDFITEGRLIQYDFTHSPPRRTFITLVGTDNPINGGGNLQLGPDGRLYAGASTEYLWVIHYPNRAGNACQQQRHPFNFLAGHPEGLGQNRRAPLSAFPNYMDHIFNGLEAAEWAEGGPADGGTELRVYPNPTTGVVDLALPGAAGGCGPAQPARLALYSALGQTLAAGREADFASGPVQWNLGGLAAGLYLARVEAAGRVWVRKVVVLPKE